jgi:hypothetical protein
MCERTTSCGYVSVEATIFDAALATTCAAQRALLITMVFLKVYIR